MFESIMYFILIVVVLGFILYLRKSFFSANENDDINYLKQKTVQGGNVYLNISKKECSRFGVYFGKIIETESYGKGRVAGIGDTTPENPHSGSMKRAHPDGHQAVWVWFYNDGGKVQKVSRVEIM